MTKMELCRSLQYLSDSIISEADASRFEVEPRKKFGLAKYAALAACAAVVIFAGAYAIKSSNIRVEQPEVTGTGISESETVGGSGCDDPNPPVEISYDNLPKIPLSAFTETYGGQGGGGFFANDISEIAGSSPMTTADEIVLSYNAPTTLPVYRNATKWYGNYAEHTDYDKMLKTLDDYMALWVPGLKASNSLEITEDAPHAPVEGDGVDINEMFEDIWGIPAPIGVYEPEALEATHNGITVRVIGEYQVTVRLTGEKLPDGYSCDTYENALEAAEYIKEKYADKIRLENPLINISGGTRNVYGEQSGYAIHFYESAQESEQLLINRYFRSVSFSCSESGITVRYDITNIDNLVGYYPTITLDEAIELFKQGKYIGSASDYEYDAENIVKTELVYLAGKTSEYYIPCYNVYVYIPGAPIEASTDMHLYEICYVPAIEPRFIDGGESDTAAEVTALPQLRYELGDVSMGFEGIMLYSFDEWKNDNPWFGLESDLYGSELPAYVFQTPYVSCGGNGSFRVIDCDEDYMRRELKKLTEKFGVDISNYEIKSNAPKEKEIEKVRENLQRDLERGYLESEEEIEEILKNYCRPNRLTVETEDYIFEVEAGEFSGYTADVEFKNPVDLGISADANEEEAVEAVAQRYGKLMLGDGEIVVCVEGGDRDIYGEATDYRGFIYLAGQTAVETILNYNFNVMDFRLSEGGLTSISVSLDGTYKKLGDYRILGSEEEVLERMRQGKFLTTSPVKAPDLEKIASLELCYRSDGLPYFKLWIEITEELKVEGYVGTPEGMLEYGAYYVPAVIDKYVDGSMPWDGGFN